VTGVRHFIEILTFIITKTPAPRLKLRNLRQMLDLGTAFLSHLLSPAGLRLLSTWQGSYELWKWALECGSSGPLTLELRESLRYFSGNGV